MPIIDSDSPCVVEACKSGRYSKRTGFCKKHYRAYQRGDLTTAPLPLGYGECIVETCNSLVSRTGYCQVHYLQKGRGQEPHGPGAPHSCIRPDCGRPVLRLKSGLCSHHYSGAGRPREVDRSQWEECPIPLCNRHMAASRGVCQYHRERAKTYGLTAAELIALVGDGVCPACGRNDEPLAVHHDHHCCPNGGSCGKCVISALCGKCNRGAGLAMDSPKVLRNLAKIMESGSWRERR